MIFKAQTYSYLLKIIQLAIIFQDMETIFNKLRMGLYLQIKTNLIFMYQITTKLILSK